MTLGVSVAPVFSLASLVFVVHVLVLASLVSLTLAPLVGVRVLVGVRSVLAPGLPFGPEMEILASVLSPCSGWRWVRVGALFGARVFGDARDVVVRVDAGLGAARVFGCVRVQIGIRCVGGALEFAVAHMASLARVIYAALDYLVGVGVCCCARLLGGTHTLVGIHFLCGTFALSLASVFSLAPVLSASTPVFLLTSMVSVALVVSVALLLFAGVPVLYSARMLWMVSIVSLAPVLLLVPVFVGT
ncbi:hypothetical protein PPTG_08571 [Phytophthora nicotianae INRA-310]|uniref:Uncharacterized protein n=1 Tax=Phytophthora nicotianae (strain INRA-310) TaxID=761204 RepID=W2QL71_PHYN3|nr:hypothetical protein PPTG_08571 [Phytophthora nicotianae INRA-310]ETN13883.1 hypothetical protein PPTG_08571 [Phytophthora nicotianae INRA-310]